MSRFEQLYQVGMAKAKTRRTLSQKPLDAREYESQKEECTFRPAKIAKYNWNGEPVGRNSSAKKAVDMFKLYREQQEPADAQDKEDVPRGSVSRKVDELRAKSQKEDAERRQ